jgi:peptide/nickel transport system permease protein
MNARGVTRVREEREGMCSQRAQMAVYTKGWAMENSLLTQARNFVLLLRKKPLGAAGLLFFVLFILIAALAPLCATHDPFATEVFNRLKAPSPEHWLGTDELGRDVWSRVVFGGRVSLQVGIFAVLLGSTTGMLVGLISGYFRGRMDMAIQRMVEIMLCFPTILLALTLVSALGAGLDKLIIALAIVFVPSTARVMRGAVLAVRESNYMEAAITIGAGHLRIMFRHILPNIAAPFLIIVTSQLGAAILVEATLSFLGLGIPPPTPSWGMMLTAAASKYVRSAPWLVVFPGMAISVLVLSINLVGDALRDIWDPRLKGA